MNTRLQRALQLFRSELAASRPSIVASRIARQPFTTAAPYSTSISKDTSVPFIESPVETVQNPLPKTAAKSAQLPVCCPGCGALSQTQFRHEAGYYDTRDDRIKEYVHQGRETALLKAALQKASSDTLKHFGGKDLPQLQPTELDAPYCERCHQLQHHQVGASIDHPTLKAIEAIISESDHNRNHVWHVVDAADFPMSVIMNMDQRLSLAYLRTRNRRSKNKKFRRGQQVDMSFIITRADLLAPKKEQVDALVPKLREILRKRLGVEGRDLRLGNMHVVSADRGWWTKPIKEKLLDEMGAHWLVGKVNVGKSKLFETIFPRGTNKIADTVRRVEKIVEETSSIDKLLKAAGVQSQHNGAVKNSPTAQNPWQDEDLETPTTSQDTIFNDKFSLLPPKQPLRQFPVMPIINKLPGTTASPIRVPFRNGSGELIDLPGLQRGRLEDYVIEHHRKDLVMTNRVKPERIVIKPGRSLLLGGLIRITPTSEDVIVMAHSFTPLTTHLTSNPKAEAIHMGEMESGIPTIIEPSARDNIKSAGIFRLTDDVTRTYAGPLTRKDAVKLKPERLPFTIYAADILIEGVGWVELVAQVRKPKTPAVRQQLLPNEGEHNLDLELDAGADGEAMARPAFPEVEIFSPEGKFIGQRSSICGFHLGAPIKKKTGARPRRSMKSVKAQRKPQRKTE